MTTTTLAIAKPEIWETVPGAYVLSIVEAFSQRRIDVLPSLHRFGIQEPLKNDTPVGAHEAGTWLEYVLETFPQPGFGLAFSGLTTLLDHGMVGYTILSSDTVGEAIIERIRFSSLLRPYFGARPCHVGGYGAANTRCGWTFRERALRVLRPAAARSVPGGVRLPGAV
jgi:hypothetical protein